VSFEDGGGGRERPRFIEDEVGGEGGRRLAELSECIFGVEGVAGLGRWRSVRPR